MKTLISVGKAPPIECFINHNGVAVRMKGHGVAVGVKTLISVGVAVSYKK